MRFRGIITYVLLTAFLGIWMGCQKRDWDNPYDPECPKELFTPKGLNAVQEGNLIKLSWSQNNKQITKYLISRNANGGQWTEISNTHTGFTTYTDLSPIVGGVTYGYKVIAVAGDNPSNAIQTTIKAISAPTISTNAPANIAANSATLGGNVTSDGGATVIERGVVFSTKTNPTTTDNRVTIGTGNGSFNKDITGLMAGRKYYVRAYAINVMGTSYGNELNFTTPTTTPSITTKAITVFSDNAANVGGIVLSNGGIELTQGGICFSTSPNPTTSNNRLILTSENDTLTGTIKNLQPNTTYYVRAYAINLKGTSYGDQVIFKTDPVLKDIDGNVYKTVIIGNQVWMAENLKTTKYQDGTAIPYVSDIESWANLTSGAYCSFMNSATNATIYGYLYNFMAVVNERKLSPPGWHVPSDEEWSILMEFAGGKEVAGGKLKEVGFEFWNDPNAGATNETGFSARGGSWRGNSGGFYYNVGRTAEFWTSSEFDSQSPWFYEIAYNSGSLNRRYHVAYFLKNAGLNIRCVKD